MRCFAVSAAMTAALAGFGAAIPAWDLVNPPRAPGGLAVDPDQPEATRQPDTPSYAEQVVQLVNQQRWSYNNLHLPPLKAVAELDTAAGDHSEAMAVRNFFAHCDLDTGTSPWQRMVAAGYSWSTAGENIAAGYGTPAAVVAGWMASPGHRANILDGDFRELGVGYYYQSGDAANVRLDQDGNCVQDGVDGPYGHYWTQDFGARAGVYPVVIEREAPTTPSRDVELYLYGGGWASEMRLRNAGGTWTAWQSFQSEVAWQLAAGAGLRQVDVEIRSGATVRAASDTIVSEDTTDEIFSDGFETGGFASWSDVVR